MSLTHYVFRSIWSVPAPMVDVMPVLDDLESYPAWWPEMREVRPLGGRRFEVVARSFLPYELRFVSESDEPDLSSGVIDARFVRRHGGHGPLDGGGGRRRLPDGL